MILRYEPGAYRGHATLVTRYAARRCRRWQARVRRHAATPSSASRHATLTITAAASFSPPPLRLPHCYAIIVAATDAMTYIMMPLAAALHAYAIITPRRCYIQPSLVAASAEYCRYMLPPLRTHISPAASCYAIRYTYCRVYITMPLLHTLR